jgi:hypothetical protein
VAWFDAAEYEALRALLPDRRWHATHAQWLAAAEQNEQRLQRAGIRTVHVHIHPDGLVAWCRSAGRNIDTHALTAFCNEHAMHVYTDTQLH